MSRYDDDHPQRPARARNEGRDPYEAQRQVRNVGDDDQFAEQPWRAAHPQHQRESGTRAPRWDEQPARYGGGYRDDELWRGDRGDARYGLDTDNERAYGQHLQQQDYRRRHERSPWQGQRGYERNAHGQDNSGYDEARSYGQRRHQDDARSDYARASWTQEHDYEGPRYGSTRSASGQFAHTDIYGGAGFRQQGKRYWFDEGDQRSQFRGTRPRGYERSDERLRELACERLTDADVDASEIEVKVSQGTVTLEGSVPARWMKHQAEDIVDDLGGVKDIQNHLRVSRGETHPVTTPSVSGTTTSPAPGTTASSSGAAPGGDIGGRSRH